MPTISKALKYSYDIQDLTYNSLMSLKEQMTNEQGKLKIDRDTGRVISDLVKAHCMIQERVAFHRRVPSPGTLRPEPKQKRPTLRTWAKVQAVEGPIQPAIEVLPQPQLPAPPAPEQTPQ